MNYFRQICARFRRARWLCCFIVVLLSSCEQESKSSLPSYLPAAPAGKSWVLAWADEFDGPTLDMNNWEHVRWVPEGQDQPRRDGYWRNDAAYTDGNGHLVIKTYEDQGKYISGAIRTKGKFEKAYGYFVARAKLHSQPGHWPAFWLLTDSITSIGNGGTDGVEIDIMEKPSLGNLTRSAIHWDGWGEFLQSEGLLLYTKDVMSGYHTFALWWTPDEYVFYVDGEEKWRTAAGGVCQVPLYIKLTDEVGTWAGSISDAILPDYFTVDYVRVYDLVDR